MLQLQRATHTQFANALLSEALYGTGNAQGVPMKALEILAHEAVSIWAKLQIATTGGFLRRGTISTQLNRSSWYAHNQYVNGSSAHYLHVLKQLANVQPNQTTSLLSAHPTAFAALFMPESELIIESINLGSSE